MKYVLLMFLSLNVNAKEYTFNYQLGNRALTIKQQSESKDLAYKMAAKECFKYFMGLEKVFNYEYGLNVIDTCANGYGW